MSGLQLPPCSCSGGSSACLIAFFKTHSPKHAVPAVVDALVARHSKEIVSLPACDRVVCMLAFVFLVAITCECQLGSL